jgi:hypothetical protein
MRHLIPIEFVTSVSNAQIIFAHLLVHVILKKIRKMPVSPKTGISGQLL